MIRLTGKEKGFGILVYTFLSFDRMSEQSTKKHHFLRKFPRRRKKKRKDLETHLGGEDLHLLFFNLARARVSVPCSNLFDIVTVRCGHCSNLWSVNMAAAFQSLSWQNSQASNHSHSGSAADYRVELGSSSKCNNKMKMRAPIKNPTNDDQRVINRPPEKRQRVPSAYNQFIKEEIQRIKANNPDITHREAFSTAAKNWAHFPHIHFGLMLETNNLQTKNDGSEKHLMSVPGLHY